MLKRHNYRQVIKFLDGNVASQIKLTFTGVRIDVDFLQSNVQKQLKINNTYTRHLSF